MQPSSPTHDIGSKSVLESSSIVLQIVYYKACELDTLYLCFVVLQEEKYSTHHFTLSLQNFVGYFDWFQNFDSFWHNVPVIWCNFGAFVLMILGQLQTKMASSTCSDPLNQTWNPIGPLYVVSICICADLVLPG